MAATPPPSRSMAYLIALGQVGLEMVVPIALGVIVDRWWGTTPWLMIAGVVAGLLLGFVHMIALLRRLDQAERSAKHSKKQA